MEPGVISLETVPVGNPGNAGEWSGLSDGGAGPDAIVGGVAYAYNIGKYEVTAAQYTAFLNAVAKADTYGLYSTNMADPVNYYGCNIQRSGSSGSYAYSVASNWANRPVNYVSWGDAARFCNWLSHGQPTGAQGLATTEDGSYYLNGETSQGALMAVTRKTGATWVIPTENEWYKSAYHKNDGVTGNYWDYPTITNSVPNNGNPGGDTGNTANFYDGDYTVGSPYWTTPVGLFSLSDSPYGTFDQVGNLWEWNETAIYAGSSRGLRGGGCREDSGYFLASNRSFAADPPYEDPDLGFRVSSISAITIIWNGGGTDDNWTNPANWGGWTPIATHELTFGPATHVSNHNNFPADTQFNGITFRNDAATYTLNGNRLKLAGPLVNNSPATQTIALDLVLQSGGGTIDTAAGDIVLSGTVGGAVGLIKRGATTLTLRNTVSAPITVEQGQVVAAHGSLVNGNLAVAAGARFDSAGGTVSLGNLTNSGTLAGNAQVSGTLANQSSGSVRIGAGQKVLVLGTTAHDNAGLIEALGNPYVLGGQAEFECAGPLTNAAGTGMITGRSAVLRFSGGLANQGAVALSYGLNDVFGDVDNTGNISVAGGASVTFYDDVVQNGSLAVSAVGATRSTAVFFGGFTGSGGFSGGGDVFLMGDLRPGNSPAEVGFGGNVFMGGSTHTLMELGGILPGSQYDKMDVTGTLALGGSLDVVLYNGFAPKPGDSFDLFDGTIEGSFDAVTLPVLDSGLSWNQSQLYSTGVISIVPEPSTLALLGVAVVGLIGIAGRGWRTDAIVSGVEAATK